MPDADLDVLVVVEAGLEPNRPVTFSSSWPVGYFDLFGSLRDIGLERPPQGELQDRLPLVPTYL